MPGFDRTGPQGQGAMTGGRKGLCGAGTPAVNVGYRRGWGRGPCGGGAAYGPGRGFRRSVGWGPGNYDPAYSPVGAEDEKRLLKENARNLKNQLEAINKRLDDLEGE